MYRSHSKKLETKAHVQRGRSTPIGGQQPPVVGKALAGREKARAFYRGLHVMFAQNGQAIAKRNIPGK
jgi:hypothetical protein